MIHEIERYKRTITIRNFNDPVFDRFNWNPVDYPDGLISWTNFFKMNELKLTATKNSPEITASLDGVIKIRGRSILENSIDFFKPVNEWVAEYIKDPADVTCVDVSLEYFNSASTKIIVNLLQKISLVRLNNKKFIINWYYEEGDEDILERGEYFSSVLNIPFNFIRIT